MFKQQINIAGLPPAAMVRDHPAPPLIREGIAPRPEEAIQPPGFEGAWTQPQLHWIKLHRVRPLPKAAAEDKRAHRLTVQIAAQ